VNTLFFSIFLGKSLNYFSPKKKGATMEALEIISGLIVGVLFGFVCQRGRFCMSFGFRDAILKKDYTVVKAVVLGIIVSMLGFHAMASLGIIQLNPKPCFWGANIIGGFMFGIGIALAGGCAVGTTYKVGEGAVGSFVALLGYMILADITSAGALKPVKDYLQKSTIISITNPGPLLSPKVKSPTLANIVGIHPWIIVIITAIIGIGVLIWKRGGEGKVEGSLYEKYFKKGWPWWVTGIAIGIVEIIAYPTSAIIGGRNYPLGITGGWSAFLDALIKGDPKILGWETFLVIGVPIGAAIAAGIAGEFKLRAPSPGRLLEQFFGGSLMGVGAVIAGGCNIGHLLSGIPHLGIGSILTGLFIIFGCCVTAYLLREHLRESTGL
jgi:uncharacterized membrane protein YedE/YeeE